MLAAVDNRVSISTVVMSSTPTVLVPGSGETTLVAIALLTSDRRSCCAINLVDQ